MAPEPNDAELDAAAERGREFEQSTLMAIAARYDAPSGRLVIDFANGATFMVPARSLQDLEQASDEDLADVEVQFGTLLRWNRLDVDFTVQGLVSGLFGTATYMAARSDRVNLPQTTKAREKNDTQPSNPRKAI